MLLLPLQYFLYMSVNLCYSQRILACGRAAEDLLALPDISMEESEDLPRILAPLADDAAGAALGRAGAGAGAAPSRAQLLAALEARAPALLRLRVRLRPLILNLYP